MACVLSKVRNGLCSSSFKGILALKHPRKQDKKFQIMGYKCLFGKLLVLT